MALAAVVLTATLAVPPAMASEEPAEASEPTTITTVLHPGWNMVGWVGPETPASDLFDEIPALAGIFAWDGEAGGYRLRARPLVHLLDPLMLTAGQGLWLFLDSDAPVEWTREASEHSVLLELQAGRNLVAWAGRDGTPIEEATVRFGERLVRAWRWDAEASRYRLYHPHAAANSLTELNHGDALLVELVEDARWWQSGAAVPVVFLGEFTEDERAEIVGWVDGTRALFGERWGVEGPVTTTYVGDREAVAPTYRKVRARNDVTPCGDYGGWVIFLIDGCVNGGAHAHEYFHALQGHLMEWSGKLVPGWMLEGSASYALILYRGTISTTQTSDERVQEARSQDTKLLGRRSLPTLQELEPYGATVQPGNSGYTLGFLAVAWLAERAGELSIVDFFVRLANEPSWSEAFEGAFGLTVDDFYEQFEAYRAEVTTPLPHLMDDDPEPVLVFVGAVPAHSREAVREEFERLQTFFEEELGAGTPDYTMLVSFDDASTRMAHVLVYGSEHDGYCNNALAGVAGIVNLGCPARFTDTLPWPHFVNVREHAAPSASLPLDPDGQATRGPAWFDRAALWYVLSRYNDWAGYGDYGALKAIEVSRAARTLRPLSSMVPDDWFYQDGFWEARGVAFLAVDWLFERIGDTALFDYYRRLPDSQSWEEAFEAAFGITVDDFYEQFEAYRARVAPPN